MANRPDSINIEILQEGVTVKTTKGGVTSIKETNLEQIQRQLTSNERIETPLLPSIWGVQKYVKRGKRELYVITTPPGIRKVQYTGDDRGEYEIPVPAAVWFVTSQERAGGGRQLVHTTVYAIKNPILTGIEQLYRMPFSNCDNSYICWGDESPQISSPKSIQSIPDRFFGMPFNSDLGSNAYQPIKEEIDGKEISHFRINHLFRYLDRKLKADKDFRFPNNHLNSYESFKRVLDHELRRLS